MTQTITTMLQRLLEALQPTRTRRARAEAAIRRLEDAARYHGTPTLAQRQAMDDLEWMPRRMGGR